jgi:hypothetical protein
MATFGPNEQYPFAFSRILVKSNSFKFEFLDFRISLYKLFMFRKISIFSLVLPFCHLKPIEKLMNKLVKYFYGLICLGGS